MKGYYFSVIIFCLLSCKNVVKQVDTQADDSLVSDSSVSVPASDPSVQDTISQIKTKPQDLPEKVTKKDPVRFEEQQYPEEDINAVEIVKDSSKYYIYFTLDDGPQLPGTQICKDILEENNIKATFFMVGTHNVGAKRKNLVDSINNNPLFIVSNHSDTHGFRNRYSTFYNNPKSSLQDFITAESKLAIKHKIARLPGRNTWAINNKLKGESSAFGVARKLDSLGYSVYGWDVEWKFIHGNVPVESATEMIKKVENTLKRGRTYRSNSIVILVHDRMFEKPQYADSLRKFITVLGSNDKYIFETLDNWNISL
ncbi:MAG: polysaccharide deacetylase family protein [Flavobacteriaceae bacterium]|jgi:peptidoglycan/xylan/chitin deacetylase (PgdA/CDA1 family)|nr:polysaccharide deacetylase family protein [Flavobacteriaceae bacterium]